MAWIEPATALVGQLATAAFWNAEVRDHLTFLQPISYTEKQTDTTIPNTAVAEATATTIIGPSPSFTYDGNTTIDIWFGTPESTTGNSGSGLTSVTFVLVEDSTIIGRLGTWRQAGGGSNTNESQPILMRHRHKPSAAAHTYSVAGFTTSVSVGAVVRGGAGGSGVFFATSLEILRVAV